ncbi:MULTISPECIES: hypothetical protein [unclassified Caballeronia]|uniref:COG4648 family protein n=1 Tax=unclassified Caballeronia TaxID=2646786 RepID=UPI0038571D40
MPVGHSRSGGRTTAEPAHDRTRSRLADKALSAARCALAVAYPATILCAWLWDKPRLIGALLLALLWMQRWLGRGVVATSLRRLTALDWCVAAVLSGVSVAIVLTGSERLMRLYPSFVNLGLLVAFGATLVRGPSMIEKFARLGNPQLDALGVRHTLRVTQIWCAFFACNAAFSAYTALQWSRAAWSLYNGGIVYGVIGGLLLGELAWRHLAVLPRSVRSESA